ncbi:MAG: metallophosphatase domain-containing protein [Muribaculaceae bacterium]|nr:metallophosphatase domain-containing protein [Muribaculaceae bacterium]
MRILHLSDTHGCHRRLQDLPEADVVVHSGDFCMAGTEDEAFDFINWFCDLPYKHKIFIAGNHDDCLYGAEIEGLDNNTHYLCNTRIEIEGIKFYGIPMFMEDCISGRENIHYAKIPTDTDILITHNPPYGILDFDSGMNYGSERLLEKLTTLNLKAHLFGHIHSTHGIEVINGKTFSNGAIMHSDYTQHNYPNMLIIN